MIFFSKESKPDFFEGVKVRENWLVLVNLFYTESKSKKKIFFLFPFFFFFVGGGGERERGGAE